jgi:hypothetical protein
MSETANTKGERLKEELRKYAFISAYLFVCFGVILLYESALLSTDGGNPLPWTLALVKALVMGKFILIGEALSVGAKANAHPLLHRIFWKSLAMLALLVVFKLIEELVVGWFHDRTAAQVMSEFFERSWIQIVAPVLLMLLILIPLVSAAEIYKAVGGERMQKFLLGDHSEAG